MNNQKKLAGVILTQQISENSTNTGYTQQLPAHKCTRKTAIYPLFQNAAKKYRQNH